MWFGIQTFSIRRTTYVVYEHFIIHTYFVNSCIIKQVFLFSDDNPDSKPYYKYTGSDYYNLQQLEENYQIAQHHQEIRSHYAQQNPGGNLLGKGMLGGGESHDIKPSIGPTSKMYFRLFALGLFLTI